MGASGWGYWIDYDNNTARAFAALRDRVFKEGDYLGPGGKLPFGEGRDPRSASSIEAVLEAQAEDGTHSILDISRFETPGERRPTKKMVNPFTGEGLGASCRLATDAELTDVFGTSEPTRAMVEEHAGELERHLSRWSALCVVVFAADKPNELYFHGISGD